MPPVVIVSAALVIIAVVSLVGMLTRATLTAGIGQRRTVRYAAGTHGSRGPVGRHRPHRRYRVALPTLSNTILRFIPQGLTARLDRILTLCGRPAAWSVERLVVAKLLLGAVACMWGLLVLVDELTGATVLTWGVITVAGFSAPDVLLKSRGAERQKLIDRELPNVLDQVTIAVEAGLGFEAALARAAQAGSGPLSAELTRTLQEIQFGVARGQAMRNLAARVDSPDLRHFVTAIIQAESYGISVADILRTQAAEQRIKRRQRAEEHALKVPVKMVLPLILCILPALFVVILGPAVVQISRTMFNNGGF